jgi:hypothetical protein
MRVEPILPDQAYNISHSVYPYTYSVYQFTLPIEYSCFLLSVPDFSDLEGLEPDLFVYSNFS